VKQFNIRLREPERERIVALAQKLGVSQADAVRLLLLGALPPVQMVQTAVTGADKSADGGA
jgi:hypothetical protein